MSKNRIGVHSMNKVLLIAVALLALPGCASLQQAAGAESKILQSWQGEPIEKMVAYWGAPTGQYSRAGKQVVVWSYHQCAREVVVEEGKVAGGSSSGANCCMMAVAGYCKGLLNPHSGS